MGFKSFGQGGGVRTRQFSRGDGKENVELCCALLVRYRAKILAEMNLDLFKISSQCINYIKLLTHKKFSAYNMWQPFSIYPFFVLTQTVSFSAQKG